MCTVLSLEKKNREINLHIISLVRKLIWRHFCREQNSVIFTLWIICSFLRTQFFATFLSNRRFTKELYCKLIWRKKFCVAVISRFSTLCYICTSNYVNAQCGKMKNLLPPKKISSINYLVFSLAKPLISRDFCQKKCETKYPHFSMSKIYSLKIISKNSVKSTDVS